MYPKQVYGYSELIENYVDSYDFKKDAFRVLVGHSLGGGITQVTKNGFYILPCGDKKNVQK